MFNVLELDFINYRKDVVVEKKKRKICLVFYEFHGFS